MSLFLKKQLSCETLLGVWHVTETYEELLSILPDTGKMYADRLESFKSESRKKEFLAVRVLLYILLNEQKQIVYNTSGKPYFGDKSGYLSISHTKGYVAVIVSKSNAVGIDIEQRGEKVDRVAHKFVRKDEEYENHPLEQTTRRLLIWSAKEVMFKCLDTTDVDFLEHLKINFSANNDEPVINALETRTSYKHRFIISYLLHDDFVMTWTILD